MVPDNLKAHLQEIHTALGMGRHASWVSVMSDRSPGAIKWYRDALTSLVFAVGDSEILFVAASGEGDDRAKGFTAGGAVLTADRVVALHAAIPAGGGRAAWSVVVRGLSALESVEVHADAEPFHETMDGEWPALTTVSLTFRSADVMTLTATDKSGRERLAALTSTLIRRIG